MAVLFVSSSLSSVSAALLSPTISFSKNDSISQTRPVSVPLKPLLSKPPKPINELSGSSRYGKWRRRVSFFPSFLTRAEDDTETLKEELLEAIAPLDRGAEATLEDQKRIDQIASKIEAKNKVKEPLKSNLLNGKWELLYTTSTSILQTKRPKLLRPNGKIYQAINGDTLRTQNMETWPFFNQIPIKARGSGRGQLEITYLDEELRISRGNQGNLFILKMVDPSYRIPLS